MNIKMVMWILTFPTLNMQNLTILPFVYIKTKITHVFVLTNQCIIISKVGNTLLHLTPYFLSWIIRLSLNNTLHNNFVLPFHFAILILTVTNHIVFALEQQQLQPREDSQSCKFKQWVDGTPMLSGNISVFLHYNFKTLFCVLFSQGLIVLFSM